MKVWRGLMLNQMVPPFLKLCPYLQLPGLLEQIMLLWGDLAKAGFCLAVLAVGHQIPLTLSGHSPLNSIQCVCFGAARLPLWWHSSLLIDSGPCLVAKVFSHMAQSRNQITLCAVLFLWVKEWLWPCGSGPRGRSKRPKAGLGLYGW